MRGWPRAPVSGAPSATPGDFVTQGQDAGDQRLNQERTVTVLDGERRGWIATPAVRVEAFSGVQGLSPAPVALESTTYALTPAAVEVHAGIIVGEITDMRVVQRVERSPDRVISGPRLMGAFRLWSSSETHSVRLVVAKIQYLDDQWRPMKLEDSRIEATFRLTTYGNEWLDPGQKATHAVDVPFPAGALTARKLTRLRLEIGYVSTPYREEIFSFGVSIGSPQGER